MGTESDDIKATAAEIRQIEQRVAKDLMEMVGRHKPLNHQEQRLMDAIRSEVGVKYGILPPQEGYKVERIEEKLPREWF